MPRPTEKRRVQGPPPCGYFKPAGIRAVDLEEVCLTVDEFEVLRLIDFEGVYQEQAAEAMGVSRQTVGRMAERARRKVADVLVNAKALRIEGGEYITGGTRSFACGACKHHWELPFGTPREETCPECGDESISRTDEEKGRAQNRGLGRGRRGANQAGGEQATQKQGPGKRGGGRGAGRKPGGGRGRQG